MKMISLFSVRLKYCNNTAIHCDGPNVMLFIHIASYTKNDKNYGSFIHEKLTKIWIISYMKLHMKSVTSGPSLFMSHLDHYHNHFFICILY